MRKSPFAALKVRDFRIFWFSFLVTRVGSEMQIVALTWHLYILTKSPISLGFIGLARLIPLFLFSPVGGLVTDIVDRKKLIIITQIAGGLLALSLAFFSQQQLITPFIIYAAVALNSFFLNFEAPARQSLLPTLVPKELFVNAVSLNTILWQASALIGPMIAGFLLDFSGATTIYALNAGSFLFLVVTLFKITVPKYKAPAHVTFSLGQLKEGITFILATPIILSTMLLDFVATFFSSATQLLPVFASDILRVGPRGLGFLYAAPAIGSVVAGLVLSSFGHIRNQGKLLLTAVVVYGVATVLFGLSHSFLLSLLFLALTGVGDVVSTIIRNTIRQIVTPEHLRGRMVSIVMMFAAGGPQLGEIEAGFLAYYVGAPFSVVLGGLGTIIITLIIALTIPRLRRYQGDSLKV